MAAENDKNLRSLNAAVGVFAIAGSTDAIQADNEIQAFIAKFLELNPFLVLRNWFFVEKEPPRKIIERLYEHGKKEIFEFISKFDPNELLKEYADQLLKALNDARKIYCDKITKSFSTFAFEISRYGYQEPEAEEFATAAEKLVWESLEQGNNDRPSAYNPEYTSLNSEVRPPPYNPDYLPIATPVFDNNPNNYPMANVVPTPAPQSFKTKQQREKEEWQAYAEMKIKEILERIYKPQHNDNFRRCGDFFIRDIYYSANEYNFVTQRELRELSDNVRKNLPVRLSQPGSHLPSMIPRPPGFKTTK